MISGTSDGYTGFRWTKSICVALMVVVVIKEAQGSQTLLSTSGLGYVEVRGRERRESAVDRGRHQ